jgi:hypothetical protein
VNDTHPVVEAMLIEGFRRMSPAEKFRRVEDLNNTVLEFAALRLRKQYGAYAHEARIFNCLIVALRQADCVTNLLNEKSGLPNSSTSWAIQRGAATLINP